MEQDNNFAEIVFGRSQVAQRPLFLLQNHQLYRLFRGW